MSTFAFYNANTGYFTGNHISDNRYVILEDLPANYIPAGCLPLVARYDYLSQMVDVSSNTVVAYIPPQPSAVHEWNATKKRWVLTGAEQERLRVIDLAQTTINNLEARQHRSVREVLLGVDGALQRLEALDAEIAVHRATIAANK